MLSLRLPVKKQASDTKEPAISLFEKINIFRNITGQQELLSTASSKPDFEVVDDDSI